MKQVLCTVVALYSSTSMALSLACKSQIGGIWGYASSPSACAVSSLAPQDATTRDFGPLIFHDGGNISQNRISYMNPMNAFLKDTATYYIRRRNPQVSQAEVDGFVLGVLAMAAQETGWTHYRMGTDKVLRYMRGDSLHGHGLLQIDDRSHTKELQAGRGVDLMYNMLLGLDQYYMEWSASAHLSCIKASSDYSSRARAAWAAYNGGPGSLCRFKYNGSTDLSYYHHLTKKDWNVYITNSAVANPVNTVCLAEGTRPCSSRSSLALALEQPNFTCDNIHAAIEPQLPTGAPNLDVSRLLIQAKSLESCLGVRCGFAADDDKSAYLMKERVVASLLTQAASLVNVDNPEITNQALEFLKSHDGFVVEAALEVLAKQKRSPVAFAQVLNLFVETSDTSLLHQIMEQLERYDDEISQSQVHEAMAFVLSHGSPLFSRELAVRLACNRDSNRRSFSNSIETTLDKNEVQRILEY